jgi:TPP-dependent pyruvate/acetoin dehydrogenase alpha subunit
MADPDLYRTKQKIEEWKKRDPILLFQAQLKEWKLLTDSDAARIEEEVSAEIDEAVRFAEAGPWEPAEQLLNDVQEQGHAAP